MINIEYISIDLETTGFSPINNEIVEIGACKVKDGAVIDKFSRLVKINGYFPESIQNLTHITSDMLIDEEPIEVILPEFFEWCLDLPFLGHNLQFDYNFLCNKGISLGLDFTLNGTRKGYDTLKIARKYLPNIPHKLSDLVDFYKIDLGKCNFHRAFYDAYITKLLFDRLLLEHKEVAVPSIIDKNTYGKVVNNDVLVFT